MRRIMALFFQLIFFIIGKKTIINLQFSMPFVAEMDIESSSSGYERH